MLHNTIRGGIVGNITTLSGKSRDSYGEMWTTPVEKPVDSVHNRVNKPRSRGVMHRKHTMEMQTFSEKTGKLFDGCRKSSCLSSKKEKKVAIEPQKGYNRPK